MVWPIDFADVSILDWIQATLSSIINDHGRAPHIQYLVHITDLASLFTYVTRSLNSIQ